MLAMHPHPALTLALIGELDRERTRVTRSPTRRFRAPRLRVARPRRAARAAHAAC
jgi:hypothetical protein